MNFWMLPGHVATLFVSFKYALILNFDQPVTGIAGASKSEISIIKKNDVDKKHTIVINAKKSGIETNLVILTKKQRYNFYIKFDQKRAHDFVAVHSGKINSSFALKKETSCYKYFEGETSIKVENKQRNPITLNGKYIKNYGYFSKGIPLFFSCEKGGFLNENRIFIMEKKK